MKNMLYLHYLQLIPIFPRLLKKQMSTKQSNTDSLVQKLLNDWLIFIQSIKTRVMSILKFVLLLTFVFLSLSGYAIGCSSSNVLDAETLGDCDGTRVCQVGC